MTEVTDISSVGAAVTSVGAIVAKKAFADIFAKLISGAVDAASRRALKIFNREHPELEPHFAATFQRCTKIKTLLNRDQPVDLLSQYVNSRFTNGGKTIDDYELINQIWKRRFVILSGQGGGGKTVFMKYLWIAFFEHPRGRVPIFVELRRLNEVKTVDLLSFTYLSIVGTHATLSREDFDKGVHEGLFIFLFDGFDEIENEKRVEIEKQILSLANNNPNCIVIVSGRSDDRFDSWQAFSNFQILPMNKNEVIELIQKLHYDPSIKKKFVSRLKNDLYEKHKSFLSSPLLATMMLITFDQFADIPPKIHLFYEQAFDTLFAKHDATKEAFRRKTHTQLPIDVFKKYLSYFCLASYFDEKFEFSNEEVFDYIDKALKIEGAEINAMAFLADLTESVCTLQRDGTKYVFTHRSFQEFFAAYCLSRVASKHIAAALPQMSRRPTDSVVGMLYDMNSDLVESQFILPQLTQLLSEIGKINEEQFLEGYVDLFDLRLQFRIPQYSLSLNSNSDWYNLAQLLHKIYEPEFAVLRKRLKTYHQLDEKILRSNFKHLSRKKSKSIRTRPAVGHIIRSNGKFHWRLDSVTSGEAMWVHDTGLAIFLRREAQIFSDLKQQIEKRNTNKTRAFDDLLKPRTAPAV